MKYRRKIVKIEAFKLGIDYMPDWFMDEVSRNRIILHGEYRDLTGCEILTPGDSVWASKGDYIVQDVSGTIRPYKPEMFERDFEAA